MSPLKSCCVDCPWNEPGAREDMIVLLEQGETRWPCHHTAEFTDENNFKSEPRNRTCFGYLQFAKGATL